MYLYACMKVYIHVYHFSDLMMNIENNVEYNEKKRYDYLTTRSIGHVPCPREPD